MFASWFDDISLQRKLLVSFSIPIALMVLVSFSVHKNTQSMVEDNHWVVHTHKAIARAQELLNLAIDMETGQRGYLITGDPVFLEPYHLALDVWNQKVHTLCEQVSDSPKQVERLRKIDALHKQWLKEAGEKEIAQRSLVGNGTTTMQNVIALTQKQTGKQLIDKIRNEIAEFISIEQKLIQIRVKESDHSANQTSYVLFLGTLFSTFISLLVAAWSSNRIKKRIHLLLNAANQVAAGHLKQVASMLDRSPSMSGNDEVAQLTHSFQKMATTLVKSNNQMHASNRDLIAERKKAEAAAKAKSEFLSTMSHEIRTPMNGVLGISQIIASQTKEPATKENIEVILDSGQHLMTILNDILDFSKVEENKLELDIAPFNFEQVIRPVCSAIKPMADEKSIRLIVDNEVPNNIDLIGDCARLRQILFNLGGNAVKFTNEGHVFFQLALNHQDNKLLLTITDTGVGIPKDKHQHIFNSFEQADASTTRKFGGTGLGLAIVKKLVELMGGEITLNSAVGLGTKFHVSLPITWQVHKATETNSDLISTDEPFNNPLNVLLVEDNRINAIVAKGFCENFGYHVELAENGRIATEYLKTAKYDLILMDNHMPEMNGVEATQFIRQQLGLNTLIFAYTADVFREAHDSFIEAGADHILTKPLQQESFFDALQQFSSRLPKHANSESTTDITSNVIELHREPIDKLSLTEEEISQSEVIQSFKENHHDLIVLLKSTSRELEESIDQLIEAYIQQDLKSIKNTLHSVKGMALNLGLNMLAHQLTALEKQIKHQQLPEIDQLQKLINRILVNEHQAQRMIMAYAAPVTYIHGQVH
ncbi:CHASE3 domain-containing protein [Vibrio cyclitrophicus]|uniref:CHASE3 domain-containing protein n=1 Tax=Vibrio cyclitrophicus TaxID=47951 RepID=UPI000C83034C|nr:CHASE3 domain-containing protein [Vibrio cyclitrophicus]PMH76701.1 histidine kinase [Vibrio cyclitrophicus]